FNRAMLFLVDEKDRMLRGEMAVGPDNPAEAERIWTGLSALPGQSLSDLMGKLGKEREACRLDELVRQMSIPIEDSPCVLGRTLKEGRSLVVRAECRPGENTRAVCPLQGHPATGHACDVHRRLIPGNIPYECAAVPLWGKRRAIGVISVDNIFNGRPIGGEEVRLLEVLARHAGLAIEYLMVLHGIESTDRELRKSQEMLIQSEKMMALRQMAANVAHAIKNPLVSIGGFARRLDRALDPNSSTKRYTQTMIREAARLESILDGILDFSMDVEPHLGTHDFNEIVEGALDRLSRMWREGEIEVIRTLDPTLPEICCDGDQIGKILFNILANAVDAMNGRGRLSVKTYSVKEKGRGWVAAEIMDSGGGIPEDVLPNIFNPFFSTQSKETGLGLAVCHRIVTSHHGSIEVDNRPGQGVRFIIKLPWDQREDTLMQEGSPADHREGRRP
ncbi:MAG: GAF domain-containing protein, partial [Deltaproteobacteria bacterium]|nr:GAF domain-containing protein [Deltaproteobacteria bacterium]